MVFDSWLASKNNDFDKFNNYMQDKMPTEKNNTSFEQNWQDRKNKTLRYVRINSTSLATIN